MGFELEDFAFMVGSYNAYYIVKILLDIKVSQQGFPLINLLN